MKKIIVVAVVTFILGVVATNAFGQTYQPANTANWANLPKVVSAGLLSPNQYIQVDIANIIHHHDSGGTDISFYTRFYGPNQHVVILGRTDCTKSKDNTAAWNITSSGATPNAAFRPSKITITVLPSGKISKEDYILQESIGVACKVANAEDEDEEEDEDWR
ncbi:MAG: hypothetical protein H7070_02785 [Saprospiraceae bacterium]|nr:hypothetical protein [Pyrinomonadaceae bacterium]